MPEPSIEVLSWADTPLGPVCLRRRPLEGEPGLPAVVTEVTLGADVLMTNLYTASEEALSTLAVERHGGQELSVLIGGLGLGYTARAALRCPAVARVRVIERYAAVIGWLRAGLLPLSSELTDDPRLDVSMRDVYALLAGPPKRRWDLILVDVDHAPSEPLDPSSESFYTLAGLERAALHLAPGGLLGVWSRHDDEPFAEDLATIFTHVTRERIRWWQVETAEGWEDEDVLFFASDREPST
jgi:spermidine synthase